MFYKVFMKKCLLVILMVVILMMMLVVLKTDYAYIDIDLCIKIMSLCCIQLQKDQFLGSTSISLFTY